jgi:hypothetical protein
LMLVAGCASTGLSSREVGRQNYSSYVLSANDADSVPVTGPATFPVAKPVSFPMRVAVAQIGEVAPPDELIENLRKHPELFSRVEGIPAMASMDRPQFNSYNDANSTWSQRDFAYQQTQHMRGLAQSMGLDYLILCGGTIDYGTSPTPLSLADLTIVGAFVVPSKEIDGTARASAALIDAQNGGVVMISSAQTDKSHTATTIGQDGDQMKLLKAIRDDVMSKLSDRIVSDAKAHASQPVANAVSN